MRSQWRRARCERKERSTMSPDNNRRLMMIASAAIALLLVAVIVLVFRTTRSAPPTAETTDLEVGRRMTPGPEGLVVRPSCTLSTAGTQYQANEVLGTITGGPISSGGYLWFDVDLDGVAPDGCGRASFMREAPSVPGGLPFTLAF